MLLLWRNFSFRSIDWVHVNLCLFRFAIFDDLSQFIAVLSQTLHIIANQTLFSCRLTVLFYCRLTQQSHLKTPNDCDWSQPWSPSLKQIFQSIVFASTLHTVAILLLVMVIPIIMWLKCPMLKSDVLGCFTIKHKEYIDAALKLLGYIKWN